MYQKSCGRIVSRALACLPRRLKMYPTIEALRQTSEAGVFLIRFHRFHGGTSAAGAVSSRVRRGGTAFGGGLADRNSLLKLIIQIGKMAI